MGFCFIYIEFQREQGGLDTTEEIAFVRFRSIDEPFYDIGAFLEAFMAQKDGLQQFIFKFSTKSESLTRTLVVIYCKQQPIMTAADLANSNFITNYFTRLVYRGAHDQLPYFAGFGSPGGYTSYSLHYTVHYRTPSGTTGTYAFDHYGRASYGVAEINTSPESVRLMCKDFLPEGSELLAYTNISFRSCSFDLS